MRIIEVDAVWNDDESEMLGFRDTDNGTLITDYDGVDHRDDPTNVLTRLHTLMRDGDELVEMADGSDCIWYGILRNTTT